MPMSHHLVVTTTRGVYAWNSQGVLEMFSSSSGGIVAARKVKATSDLLAIADSQLIILHDYSQGHSYRLRRADQGALRMLSFDTRTEQLFFTTTLQNAVQAYSLHSNRLLHPPLPTHPSPPNVFAVSPTFDLLLSSSAEPPTTYLTNIHLFRRAPMLLHPRCSTSTVVTASFHPEQCLFALGFADGTIAVYDASLLRNPTGDEETRDVDNSSEIGHIRHLRATNSSRATSRDHSTGASIAFVPGFPSTLASVGFDGRCCILEFSRRLRGAGTLLRSWNVGPATSLSIVKNAHEGSILAIGRNDGRVLLYGLDGKLLAMRDFRDSPVLDLEWLDGSGDEALSSVSPHKAPTSSEMPSQEIMAPSSAVDDANRRPSSPSKIRVKLHMKDRPSDEKILCPKNDKDTQEKGIDGDNQGDTVASLPKDYSKTVRRIRRKKTFFVSTPRKASNASVISQSSKSSTRRDSATRNQNSQEAPTVPPRPIPRPGGKLAVHRMETAKRANNGDLADSSVLKQDAQPPIDRDSLQIPNSVKAQNALASHQNPTTNSLALHKASRSRTPRRSFSPEELRVELSKDMTALTGSKLKPIPTRAHTKLLEPSIEPKGQEALVQDATAKPAPTKDEPEDPAQVQAKVEKEVPATLPMLPEPPEPQLSYQVPSMSVVPQTPGPILSKTPMKSSRVYMPKRQIRRRSGTSAGRLSGTSQSSTSTGTLIDWHSPPPIRRIINTPGQGSKELSRVSETSLNTASASKKDSATSAGTVLDWEPRTMASVSRALPQVKESQMETSYTQPDQPLPTPFRAPGPIVFSGISSPLVSPKSDYKAQPANAGFPFLNRRETHSSHTGSIASVAQPNPNPPTNPPANTTLEPTASPPRYPTFLNSTIAGPASAFPSSTALPANSTPFAAPTAQAPQPPNPTYLPTTAGVNTRTFTPPLRPAPIPRHDLERTPPLIHARTSYTTAPSRSPELLERESTSNHNRDSSNVAWPASLYGRMGPLSSGTEGVAAGAGAEASLFTVEETVRLECADLREYIALMFEQHRAWVAGFVEERVERVVRRVMGEGQGTNNG